MSPTGTAIIPALPFQVNILRLLGGPAKYTCHGAAADS